MQGKEQEGRSCKGTEGGRCVTQCFSLVIMKISPVISCKRLALMMDKNRSGAQEEPSKKMKKKKKKKATGDGKAELIQGAEGEEDQPVGNTGDVKMGDDGTAEATGTSKAPCREHSLDYPV